MAGAVHVRGIGAVTPLGPSWPASLARLAAGESAVAPVTGFDVAGLSLHGGGGGAGRRAGGDRQRRPGARRRSPLAAAGAGGGGGLAEAGVEVGVDVEPSRLGVFIGAESGRSSFATVVALARAAAAGADSINSRSGNRPSRIGRSPPRPGGWRPTWMPAPFRRRPSPPGWPGVSGRRDRRSRCRWPVPPGRRPSPRGPAPSAPAAATSPSAGAWAPTWIP